jgi:hypothetical protein
MATDKHFYDFKTTSGPWAIGCEKCFEKRGMGLGIGRGQKYELKTLKKVCPIKKDDNGEGDDTCQWT